MSDFFQTINSAEELWNMEYLESMIKCLERHEPTEEILEKIKYVQSAIDAIIIFKNQDDNQT